MTVVIDGTLGISPVTASGTSASVDGMTVGRGGGEVSTNTAVGASALAANTTGDESTGVGYFALKTATTSGANTAFGSSALRDNTGAFNTAVGRYALIVNSTGIANSALGANALNGNTTGAYNTSLGMQSLYSNTTASNNTAVGYQAGYANTTGQYGAFLGYQAGYSSSTTSLQTCIGYQAGYGSTGSSNTFIGNQSGVSMTTGSKNTILGTYNGNQGGYDIRTGSNYIVLSDGDGNVSAITGNGRAFSLQGANVSSGTGIAFPATQSASSDANTLDDYEEGTWTPTIKGSVTAGTSTYSTQNGKYIKVGNLVFVTCYVTWNTASGTGNLRIAGLPFGGASGFYQGLAISGISGVTGSTSGYAWYGRINSGESEISIKYANFATTNPSDGDIAVCNTGTLLWTGTYTV